MLPISISTYLNGSTMPTRSTSISYGPKVHVLKHDVYHKFHNDLGICKPYEQKDGWYKVFQDENGDWWLFMRKGFMHNGADCYPDYDFMIFPSAVHDVALWLIDHGIIPEAMNNMVDKELGDCIVHSREPMPWFMGGTNPHARKLQAWKIRRGTNLAVTRRGERSALEYQITRSLI